MTEKRTRSSNGPFLMRRLPERVEFVCDRCLQPKITKIQVQWTDPRTSQAKVICNGCYGRLMSAPD